MDLDDPRVRAPEFPPSMWLNTYTEVSMSSLRGNVVLIDFWDYTCINCLRTLPYMRSWHDGYAHLGLKIVGVHTPEFPFARHPEHVKAAIGRLGIGWPVVLDNDQHIWTSYANRYWPTVYLIDARGYIRFRHAGEGRYTETEAAIQSMLKEITPTIELPTPTAPLRPEDASGAICVPSTQELHVDALGNPEPASDEPTEYTLPVDIVDGYFYLEGTWRTQYEGLTLSAPHGVITLPYHAADVYAVLSPYSEVNHPTPVDRDPRKIEILQDDMPLPRDCYGQDVLLENGHAIVRVDTPRNYHLIHNPVVESHRLRLRISDSGVTLFAFSFGSCLAADPNAAGEDKE